MVEDNKKSFFQKLSIWTLVVWIVAVAIAYFILIPPINPTSIAFWTFFLPAVFIPVFVIVQTKSFKGGIKHGKAFYPTLCNQIY